MLLRTAPWGFENFLACGFLRSNFSANTAGLLHSGHLGWNRPILFQNTGDLGDQPEWPV